MKRSGIKANPDSVRKWVQKSRTALARNPEKGLTRAGRISPVSPTKQPRRPGYSYDEFVLLVCFTRKRGIYERKACAVCGERATDAHHVIAKQRIEAMAHRLGVTVQEKVALLMDPHNGLALCSRCHDRHEHSPARNAKVSFWKLSVHNIEFAGSLDRRLGTEECAVYLERNYPR